MTMSDARKKQGAKKHAKKKAKKGAGPKVVQEIVESKNDQMKPDKMQKMIVEEPPQSVEKNIPHPKSKKGKKRKLVSSEERMDTSISEKKASTGGGGNEQLGDKLERMDDDGSPSEKKKKKPRKQKLGKLDENEEDTTSEMKDVSNISEEGKTELGGEKPLSKRKGKNKQRKKKKNKNEQANTEVQVNTARFCLRYLELWDKNRASWHFQKVRQVWLLKNMYDKTKVPKSEFHILLRYLENLQGKAREITVKNAQALIEKHEDKIQNLTKEEKSSDGEEEEDADEKKKMKIQWRRASDVLQTLS